MATWQTDPQREGMFHTGILVRARRRDGAIDNVDIGELDRDSLMEFLRSRGGENEWAEGVVLTLLGHEAD